MLGLLGLLVAEKPCNSLMFSSKKPLTPGILPVLGMLGFRGQDRGAGAFLTFLTFS